MRLFPAGKSFLQCGIAFAISLFVVLAAGALNPASTSGDQGQPVEHVSGQAPSPATPAPESSKPQGKVLFQRSLDGNGKTVSTTGLEVSANTKILQAPVASDAERLGTAVTGLDLDIRLDTEAQQIAVRALVRVR